MITLEQIKEACENTNTCHECQLAGEFGSCPFAFGAPRSWNIEEIEKRLKKGEKNGT